MKYLSCILVLLHVASGFYADNKLEKDLELNASSETVDKHNYPAFEGFIGSGKESSTTSLYFEYNFGKDVSIVGDKEAAGWGIPCAHKDKESKNSCKADDSTKKEGYYYSMRFDYNPASLFFRFSKGVKLDTDKKQTLPVQLVVSQDKWPLKSLGVLGLSPQGDFATYARQMFSDNLILLFGYEVSNPNAENDDLKFNNHVVLNPAFTDSNVVLKMNLAREDKFWSFKGDVITDNVGWKFENKNICFSSISNELILLTDATSMCRDIQKIICNGKTGDECKKDNADVRKAPELKVIFQNHTFKFKGEDYIYFKDKNVVGCRFGNITTSIDEKLCAEETELGVGRLFFSHYMPALSYNSDHSSTLILMKDYKFSNKSNLMWIIIGIVCAVILVGLVVFLVVKKRADAAEEHYTSDI